MNILAIDPGSTLALAANFRLYGIPVYTREKVSNGIVHLYDDYMCIEFTTICIKQDSEDKKQGLVGLCPKDSNPPQRFRAYQLILEDMLKANPDIDGIVYEETKFYKGHWPNVYGRGFYAILAAFCEQYDIGLDYIDVQALKRWIFGPEYHGKRDKAAATEAMQQRYPSIRNDHEAHAVALLLCYLERKENELLQGES